MIDVIYYSFSHLGHCDSSGDSECVITQVYVFEFGVESKRLSESSNTRWVYSVLRH